MLHDRDIWARRAAVVEGSVFGFGCDWAWIPGKVGVAGEMGKPIAGDTSGVGVVCGVDGKTEAKMRAAWGCTVDAAIAGFCVPWMLSLTYL